MFSIKFYAAFLLYLKFTNPENQSSMKTKLFYHDEGFVGRDRASHGRVPMCSLKFHSNTCVCYCFYSGKMFTTLFKCLIDETNTGTELYALLVSFRC